MVLNERDNRILDELINNPSVTSTTIEEEYNLTRRQLGYSINKINDWLYTNNLPLIERTRKGQFIIDQTVFSKLSGNHENFIMDSTILAEEQRVQLILLMLLGSEEELSLNHFTIELEVSKNTILSDMKQVQVFLDEYNLVNRYSRKHGYLIEGDEFQIRKLLNNVVQQVLLMSNGESRLMTLTGIKNEQINEFKQRIEKVENKLNIKFTDEKLETMPFTLILILRRIEKGSEIEAFSIKYDELSDTKEYQATEELLYDKKDIPVSERLFITLHLLTTNVYWAEDFTEDTVPNLVSAIDTMLRLFEKSACIYFQEREQLMDKLLQHIKPAYYRIKYHLTDTIQIQGSLSKEFLEIRHLVSKSIEPLKELIGSEIPASETTYITMLIGGWMNRQGESIDRKVKAIVVCPQGVSVSRLMFNDLSELFPEFVFLDSLSVREFLNYKLEYDIVFSPTYLETNKKLFISKVFLGEEEKYRLRKQVMLEIHGYIPNDRNVNQLLEIINKYSTVNNERALKEELESYLNHADDTAIVKKENPPQDLNLDDMITPANITLLDSVDSWEEAVRKAAQPLNESGIIEPIYVDAMIRSSKEDSYIVIGPNIAIPHAAPEDGVNDVGMSLLRLKEPVQYTEEFAINFVVVIAAVDKQQHIRALMQLMQFANSEIDRKHAIETDSIEEVHKILKLYSIKEMATTN
ncbi:BglG family transcription antiterminator [Oceanobacillus chungangensis]|uniref:Ascorbate-specific PTS system EIIA component n=1 Tax=Oceanobacillus chungangensis TaxID=1229152 RepID=A0A3D8Q0Z7_9BACI|nr:BglG family transcription antiterminator [Oceanobacillus chungangensis]RDW20675.1 transcription antiterminator BglG [Oceanobacillus chungangensis]